MIKGLIHQEDITILNMYISDTITLKYTKEELVVLWGEIDKFTIIIGDVNSP